MNSVYLTLILKLIGFLATSDLFAVERASLARRINPALLTIIEQLVVHVDELDMSGADKKAQVLAMIPKSFGVLPASLLNQAIEWAVAKTRVA